MASDTDTFRYLNREGKWLDFQCRGLELTPDGALRLAAIPRLSGPPPAQASPTPQQPAGLAVDRWGRVFASAPETSRIIVSGDCAPDPQTLMCLAQSAGLAP